MSKQDTATWEYLDSVNGKKEKIKEVFGFDFNPTKTTTIVWDYSGQHTRIRSIAYFYKESEDEYLNTLYSWSLDNNNLQRWSEKQHAFFPKRQMPSEIKYKLYQELDQI